MSRTRRSRPARLVGGVLWVVAAVEVGQAVVRRQRRAQIADLPALPGLGGPERGRLGDTAEAAPAPGALPRRSAFRPVNAVDVLAMADTELDEVTLAEVADLMERTGVEVVDLVPGDLPVERTLRWLRRVDPTRLVSDVLYAPGGVHEALALRPQLARRMADGARAAGDTAAELDRGRFVRFTRTAERYAPTGRAVRIAPRLRTAPWGPEDTWRELQELQAHNRPYGELAPAVIGAETAQLVLLTVGPLVNPLAGLAALAAWSAQPLLVLAGHEGSPGLRAEPAELVSASVTRLARRWAENVETIRAYRDLRPAPLPAWPAAPPTAELFEARRDTCPWCGAASLVGRLDTPDLFQHKPGSFHLDECTGCGHIFQNPRLSLAGLDHYYDNFYDGFGEEQWERAFAAMVGNYEGRVEAVARHTEPAAWLDVGTGHGHFCLVARQRWPKARFEGIDLSDSVHEAERRGWIDQGRQGQLAELAPGLAGAYDVVSMNHYLEHTREPREELAAAATVLAPGGHLLIEGPDSASPGARLGRFWRCWFQPQHQHFITCENLVAELERSGFDVVSVERAAAGEGKDLVMAASILAGRLSGPARLPWLPEPSPARRVRHPLGMVLGAPLQITALVVDLWKDAWEQRPESTTPGNAYRLVARRR